MSLVPVKSESFDVPLPNDLRQRCLICIVEVITSPSQEKLNHLTSRPVFELPFEPIYKDSHNSVPLTFSQATHTIHHLEGYLVSIEASGHFNLTTCHCLTSLIVPNSCRVAHILPILKELLDVCQANVALVVGCRDDDYWFSLLHESLTSYKIIKRGEKDLR